MTKLKIAPTVLVDPDEIEALKTRIREGSPVDDRGCWVWGASTRNGYGQMSVHDTNVYTHQASHALFIGAIPPGQHVCHTCDVKRCNNPGHFFLGTPLANVRDMWAKGRAVAPPVHRGEQNPKAILTDAQVGEIRHRVARGDKQRDVAADFECSQSTVWRLAHRVVRATAKAS